MKKTSKSAVIIAAVIAAIMPLAAMSEIVAYKLTMNLKVPRVYNNTLSQGYRKVQSQTVKGYVYIDKGTLEAGEPKVYVCGMVNNTHKVLGSKVTYDDTDAEDVMYRYIGSNRTGVFKSPHIKFSLDLNPSYNIGADEPDNALIIDLSGYGTSERLIKGGVTGQIGCACTAYGHKSPTRTLTGRVDDITPLCGTFKMNRIGNAVICR